VGSANSWSSVKRSFYEPPPIVTAFSGSLVNSGINGHENTKARRRMGLVFFVVSRLRGHQRF
jgi:hypothetical protein